MTTRRGVAVRGSPHCLKFGPWWTLALLSVLTLTPASTVRLSAQGSGVGSHYVNATAHVRAGPGMDHASLGVIPPCQIVEVTELTGNWARLRSPYDGSGYVHRGLLNPYPAVPDYETLEARAAGASEGDWERFQEAVLGHCVTWRGRAVGQEAAEGRTRPRVLVTMDPGFSSSARWNVRLRLMENRTLPTGGESLLFSGIITGLDRASGDLQIDLEQGVLWEVTSTAAGGADFSSQPPPDLPWRWGALLVLGLGWITWERARALKGLAR